MIRIGVDLGGTFMDIILAPGARSLKMLDDVLDGFVAVDHAREGYGGVLDALDGGYGWALNRQQTEALRAQRRLPRQERNARPSQCPSLREICCRE